MIKNRSEKGRFVLVGAINTLLDFGILVGLHSLGVNTLIANYLSTTAAFSFSFAANRSFTFQSKGSARTQIIPFLIVTLSGLWVLQPLVIGVVEPLLIASGQSPSASVIVAKLAATGITLVWNYLLYSRVVFKKPPAI